MRSKPTTLNSKVWKGQHSIHLRLPFLIIFGVNAWVIPFGYFSFTIQLGLAEWLYGIFLQPLKIVIF